MRKITPTRLSDSAARHIAMSEEALRLGVPEEMIRWDGLAGKPVLDTKAVAKAWLETIKPNLIAEAIAK